MDLTPTKVFLTTAFGVVLLLPAIYAGFKAMKGGLSTVVQIGLGVLIAFSIAALALMPLASQTKVGQSILGLLGIA